MNEITLDLIPSDIMPSQLPLPKVFCVDDEVHILKSLRRLLMGRNLQVETESDSVKAVERLKTEQFQVIICDMRMPELNGAQLLEQASKLQPDAWRILMTGYADMASTIAAVNLGKINQYVAKPWDNEQLIHVVQQGLKAFQLIQQNKALQQQVQLQNKKLNELNSALERQVQKRTQQLKQSLLQLKASHQQVQQSNQQLMKVLYNQINVNPLIDGRFALSVSYLCRALARKLDLSAELTENLTLAGKLFEIGLTGLPADLLSKSWYRMDAHELAHYREHVRFAQEILAPAPAIQAITDIISGQYENFNGSGTPDKRVAEQIPIGCRVLAVARDYYGFVLGRSAQVKMSAAGALAAIRAQQGVLYDPIVVKALAEVSSQVILDDVVTKKGQGLALEQLKPGMCLKHSVYNSKNMLLLAEGTVLTSAALQKLNQLLGHEQDQQLFQVT